MQSLVCKESGGAELQLSHRREACEDMFRSGQDGGSQAFPSEFLDLAWTFLVSVTESIIRKHRITQPILKMAIYETKSFSVCWVGTHFVFLKDS